MYLPYLYLQITLSDARPKQNGAVILVIADDMFLLLHPDFLGGMTRTKSVDIRCYEDFEFLSQIADL